MKCMKCGDDENWTLEGELFTEYHDAKCDVRIVCKNGKIKLDKVKHSGSWITDAFKVKCQCGGTMQLNDREGEMMVIALENAVIRNKLTIVEGKLYEIELAERRTDFCYYDVDDWEKLKNRYENLDASRWYNPVVVVAEQSEFDSEGYPKFRIRDRVVLIPGGFPGYGGRYEEFVEGNRKQYNLH